MKPRCIHPILIALLATSVTLTAITAQDTETSSTTILLSTTTTTDDGSVTAPTTAATQDAETTTTTTTSTEEEEGSPTISPTNTVPGIYNTRTSPCPGYAPSGLRGYTSLSSLQQDLEAYFHSLTEAPTISLQPTPSPSKGPTTTPSKNPTAPPTVSPSEIPTKAPITLRPSPFPTTSIRQPGTLTISPSPTIKIIIIGGGGGGGGPGPGRKLEDHPPSMSPIGEVKRLRGHKEKSLELQLEDYIESDEILLVKDFKIINGGEYPPELFYPSEIRSNPSNPQEQAYATGGQARDHVDTHLLDDGDTITFQICPNSTFSFTDESSGNDTLPITLETPLRNPVVIHCLASDYSSGDSSTSCVFSGGSIHLLINNEAYLDNEYIMDDLDNINHPLLISGITFQSASQTSVLMNDPRSPTTFENCHWKNNSGMAVVYINGTYIKPVPVTTTTTSTLNWNELSTTTSTTSNGQLRMLGDVDDNDGLVDNEDGELLFGDEEEEEDESTMTASTTFNWGRNDELIDMAEQQQEEGLFVSETASSSYNWGRFELMSPREGEKPNLVSNDKAEEEEESQVIPRLLDEEKDEPRSTISIEGGSFMGNTGAATIMVTSYSDNLRSSNGVAHLSHSIFLKLKKTTFVSEDVETSIILNSGGNFQSSRCLFANNTAESIIRSERATVEVSRTEFARNEVTGDEGIVVLDSESELDPNDDNCVNDEDVDATAGNGCDGILVGEVCQPFGADCLNRVADGPTMIPTLSPSLSPTLSPTLAASVTPTLSPAPSLTPTLSPAPSLTPTLSPAPSLSPTLSSAPVLTPITSLSPTDRVGNRAPSPTLSPTEDDDDKDDDEVPTKSPTFSPTKTSTPKPTRDRGSSTTKPTSGRESSTTSSTISAGATTSSTNEEGSRCKGGRGTGGRWKGRRKKCKSAKRTKSQKQAENKPNGRPTNEPNGRPTNKPTNSRPNGGPNRQPASGPSRPNRQPAPRPSPRAASVKSGKNRKA